MLLPFYIYAVLDRENISNSDLPRKVENETIKLLTEAPEHHEKPHAETAQLSQELHFFYCAVWDVPSYVKPVVLSFDFEQGFVQVGLYQAGHEQVHCLNIQEIVDDFDALYSNKIK